ncbi:MAG: M56 family metallopeptidase [Anaerolineales bacterium]
MIAPLALCCYLADFGVVRPALSWLAPGLLLLTFGCGIRQAVVRLWQARHFMAQLRLARMANPPTRVMRAGAGLGLTRHIVVLSTDVPLAFSAGLIRPGIYISAGLADALTDLEIRAVLLHEDQHRRRYDPLRTVVAEVFASIFYFLPIAGELRDLFKAHTELAADRYSARVAGRPALAGALHKMLTHPLALRLPAVGLVGLSATDARLSQLLDGSSPPLQLSAHSLITSSANLMLGCLLMQFIGL